MRNAICAGLTLLALTGAVRADVLEDIKPLQTRWAEINYQLDEDAREKAYDKLLEQADGVVNANPGRAEALIWHGIIASSYAGAKGGVGALKLAEKSREDLQKALALDSQALNGSAYTSLGALYYKVPGWPLAFGDDDKAREMLTTALRLNPQGIDPNFFYAEFLTEDGDYKEAMRYLQIAKQAPDRPGRESADAGRRKEIAALEQRLAAKLK